jgi:hypothetical protein
MSYFRVKAMREMCDTCPFGHSAEQTHMRKSLRPGRFDEICQSVFRGEVFVCHKTTKHDDDGEWTPSESDRECFGSIQFRERAIANRNRSEKLSRTKKKRRP